MRKYLFYQEEDLIIYLDIISFHDQYMYKLWYYLHKNRRDKREYNSFDKNTSSGVSSNIYDVESNQGIRIYNARIKHNLTIKELAKLASVNRDAISHSELNLRSLGLKSLLKISSVLNEPVYFLGAFDTMYDNTFGERFKKARYYHAHTQTEAAKVIGVYKDTIMQWEYDRNLPSSEFSNIIKSYLSILSQA